MPCMSAVAAWSYTAAATHWPQASRAAWGGALGFGAPVRFLCDYSVTTRRMRDAKGDEFTSNLVIYTERSSIQPGDRVLIGTSTAADPIAAGAVEVRSVVRAADVFDRKADDYEIWTA